LFGWFLGRREAKRAVDETARRLLKSISVDEPPSDLGPIEELVHIVRGLGPAPSARCSPPSDIRRLRAQSVEDRE
jgi:hypothetical protein